MLTRLAVLGLAMPLAGAAAPPPVAWSPAAEVAAGAGVRGPWQQNDSRYDFVDDPSVLLGDDGGLVVAWVDQARKAVLVQRRTATGAADGPPVAVDRQPRTFSWIPKLAGVPGAPRQVLVLWQEIVFSGGSHGGEMLFARSTDGGRSFTAPLNLSRSRGGDGKGRIDPAYWDNGSYDLAAATGGRVYAAWTEYDGALWFSASADGGASFAAPRLLAGGAGQRPVRAPSLAAGPGATVHLAWTEGDHPGADIHVARSSDAGATFAPPQVAGRSAGYADAPRLAVDAKGVVHLAWAESEAGPLQRQRVLYTRSTDAGGFEPARVLTPVLPGRAISAAYPSLALDGDGGVYVLCELLDDLRQRPRALGLVVSTDGGTTFGEAAAVPQGSDPRGGANGSSQGLLVRKLSVNARGGIAVANSSLLEGSHSRVWVVLGRRVR